MHTSIYIYVEISVMYFTILHTHSECFFGPVAVTDDDGIGAAHGADVLQTRASTHGHSGHSKVLNTAPSNKQLSFSFYTGFYSDIKR